eukprot:7215711-Prymnesium_polylepis.1
MGGPRKGAPLLLLLCAGVSGFQLPNPDFAISQYRDRGARAPPTSSQQRGSRELQDSLTVHNTDG